VDIGVNIDLPGWSDYPNGVYLGFDIDLANWLAQEIGFRPRFIGVTTGERMSVLGGSEDQSATKPASVKLVISNFSITDKRRGTIDFAGPYFADKQGALTLADSPLKSTGDLKDQRICASQGSTNEFRISEWDATGAPERTLRRCMELLREGKVPAVTSDQVILEAFVQHEPGLRMLTGPIGTELYGIGIPNNRPKLCEFLTDKLRKFIDLRWDQAFSANLTGLSPQDRKPRSDRLTRCEGVGDARALRQPGA
jgi:glutamate transport system substrate-binding protein